MLLFNFLYKRALIKSFGSYDSKSSHDMILMMDSFKTPKVIKFLFFPNGVGFGNTFSTFFFCLRMCEGVFRDVKTRMAPYVPVSK